MDFDEIHRLLHVLQELMCPKYLSTERWHIVANRRILVLLLIELETLQIIHFSIKNMKINLLDLINFIRKFTQNCTIFTED